MNLKKICKLLGSTVSVVSILLIAGIINNTPVRAAENDSSLTSVNKATTSAAVLVSEEKDYSIPVNKSFEDKGIKIEIKDIIASKNEIKVKTLIHKSGSLGKISSRNNIINFVVQNAEHDVSYNREESKIDDETREYTFTISNLKDFKNNLDLRFDVILPEYDFNGWVNASVDASKYYDKSLEKSLNFEMENYDFYKLESNVIGTNLLYKEKNQDFDDEKVRGLSSLLLKFKDKMYLLDESYISSYNHKEDYSIGGFSTNVLKYDDLKDADDYSVIPLEYTIKQNEARDYYKNRKDEEIEYENNDNIKYESEFDFGDGTKADVYKVVREDEKVKLYYNAESFEKAMLAGLALNGHYDFNKDDYEHYNQVNKVIYKDLEKDNGYVIEFNKVAKNKPFIIESDKLLLEHSHDFKVCDEIKLK